MATHETVDLQVRDGAATILLNRPDSLNAWNEQFGLDLLDAIETVSSDEAINEYDRHRVFFGVTANF